MTTTKSKSKLTNEQREWRKDMQSALTQVELAIVEINGPYQQTKTALDTLKTLSGIAIDDEDIGPCEECGEPIWLHADDHYVQQFCSSCIARWPEPTPPNLRSRSNE